MKRARKQPWAYPSPRHRSYAQHDAEEYYKAQIVQRRLSYYTIS